MQLSVVHSTTYRYAEPVSRSTQTIRLTPYPSARQKTLNWELSLPRPAITLRDAFDNVTSLLTIDWPHEEISLVARGRVEVDDVDDGEPAGRIDPMVFLRDTTLTEPDDALRAFVDPMRALAAKRPLIGITDLMNGILERMPYEKGYTSARSTAAEAFAAGKGVYQDHAHVFIACCRLLAVPARYVSGYVYSTNHEQVASHAWAEAWLGNRWVGFDISNSRSGVGSHLKLAIGLDYSDACPIRGVRLGGGQEELSTSAKVQAGE